MGLNRSQRHNKNMERIFRESESRGHHTLHGSTEKAKHNALKKRTSGEYKHQHVLEGIRKSLRNENISYGEIAELSKHKKHLIKSGDTELAEAAGIPEHEFNRKRKR